MDLGPAELIIILIIVVLLFGVGRIGKIGGELGAGVRAFRDGLKSDEKDEAEDQRIKPTPEVKDEKPLT